MDGLKEAMEYLVGISEPHYREHEEKLFSDRPMHLVHKKEPVAEPIEMHTLDSLVDYIWSESDKMSPDMLIHVKSPTEVSLLSGLNSDREREELVRVTAMVPEFTFGKFYGAEEFVINVMSKFVGEMDEISLERTDDGRNDKAVILKYVGTSQSGTLQDYGDDGVSQKVTIQKTVTSRDEDIVPNPVHLAPYRTFLEVEQPASDFIFRIRDDTGIAAALFEADGGAWKLAAIHAVRTYIEEKLGMFKQRDSLELSSNFTIIA